MEPNPQENEGLDAEKQALREKGAALARTLDAEAKTPTAALEVLKGMIEASKALPGGTSKQQLVSNIDEVARVRATGWTR